MKIKTVYAECEVLEHLSSCMIDVDFMGSVEPIAEIDDDKVHLDCVPYTEITNTESVKSVCIDAHACAQLILSVESESAILSDMDKAVLEEASNILWKLKKSPQYTHYRD